MTTSAMREPTYLTLVALLDGPLHGYAIIKRAKEMTAGRVRLPPGTVYPALDRLVAEALIHAIDEKVVNGRARRYYALTPEGASAVRAEAARMRDAARLVTE